MIYKQETVHKSSIYFYRNHIPQSGTVRTTELVFGIFDIKKIELPVS